MAAPPTHTHDHTHTHSHRLNATVSPQTRGIQLDFKHALGRRFKRLRGVVRATVGYEHDALALATRTNDADDIAPRESFPFGQTAAKQVAFREQLSQWLADGVLEPVDGEAVGRGEHYTGNYVRRSYAKGVEWAERQLATGAASAPDDFAPETVFNRPIHREQLRDLYTREFQNLQAITTDVDDSLSQILAEGLRDGWNPRQMATRMTEEIRDIEATRARVLARTEVMHSHNAAAARRYQERGVEQVEILPDDPCPICRALVADNPYPASEAAGLVPGRTHPRCECTIIPVL